MVVFINDILVYSRSVEEYAEHPRVVLSILRRDRLYVKFSKCELWLWQATLLGHVILGACISVDDSKVRAVLEWKTPQSVTKIYSFIGSAGYYHRFI